MNSETFTLSGGVPLEMIEIPGLGLAFGKFPITQAQWVAMMGANPSRFRSARPGGGDLPVENISWYDCLDFCARLTARTGRDFRLPTAAEWDAALVGQTASLETGWFFENSEVRTHPVGQKLPNVFGLYDMHGNVWQWCQDGDGGVKYLRGGSWLNRSIGCRSAYRDNYDPDGRLSDVGVRVVVARAASPSVLISRPSLAAIVEQLASCDYRCEAGPLVNNSYFIELRQGAQDEGCLAQSAPCGDCAWCRMFGEK